MKLTVIVKYNDKCNTDGKCKLYIELRFLNLNLKFNV